MKLNAWGRLIREIGELPADNGVPQTPAKKPKPTPFERAIRARAHAVSAERQAARFRATAERLQAQLGTGSTFDHGEINIPFSKRAKATERAVTRAAELRQVIELAEHHEARARYWYAIEQENTP